MNLITLSSFLILLSFLAFLAKLYSGTTRSKPGSNNLPPGPRKLPLIGNLHLFATSRPPHLVLHDLARKYGPLVHLRLGEVSTVVVSTPEAAKEFLKTHDVEFANRPPFLATEILGYDNTGIAMSPYGEYWRQLRKICTLELLSARRVQSFRTLRQKEFSDMCRWIASKQGLTINLTERIEMAVCNTVTQASIGKNTDEQAVLISTVKQGIDLSSGLSVADLYPSIKVLRLISGMKAKLERLHKITDKIFEDIINDARHEPYITTENIKAVIMEIFSAGVDTSSTAMDWAMAEMLRHPRVLEKAQDEVRQVFSDKGFVDESDFDQLKYLKLVIKETFRMHPPAPLLLPRLNYKPCEVNGYRLAAKTRVIVNAWAIGRDPRYWRDADSFIPERHLDISVDYKGNNFEYIPFGAGKRICPGMSLGLAHVELPLAMLLYHFDWVLPEKVDMTVSFGTTARRKDPLQVVPIVKYPLPVS